MWSYEKRLQYPVNIKEPDPVAAQIIISQYGGPYHYRGDMILCKTINIFPITKATDSKSIAFVCSSSLLHSLKIKREDFSTII